MPRAQVSSLEDYVALAGYAKEQGEFEEAAASQAKEHAEAVAARGRAEELAAELEALELELEQAESPAMVAQSKLEHETREAERAARRAAAAVEVGFGPVGAVLHRPATQQQIESDNLTEIYHAFGLIGTALSKKIAFSSQAL
jgi:hypothetical protein